MSSSLEESSTAQARDPFRDRTAPRAPEAEQAVIAAMLMDTDAILRAGEHVDDTMFYDERHRRIFRAMIAISQRNGGYCLLVHRKAASHIVGDHDNQRSRFSATKASSLSSG